jgi:hypothetical protein
VRRREAGEKRVQLQAADHEEVHVRRSLELLEQVFEHEVTRGVVARGDLVAAETFRARVSTPVA